MVKNQYIFYQYIAKNRHFISAFCSTFAKSVQEVHWGTYQYEWPPCIIVVSTLFNECQNVSPFIRYQRFNVLALWLSYSNLRGHFWHFLHFFEILTLKPRTFAWQCISMNYFEWKSLIWKLLSIFADFEQFKPKITFFYLLAIIFKKYS